MEGSTGHGQAPRNVLQSVIRLFICCLLIQNKQQSKKKLENVPRQKCCKFKGSRVLSEVGKCYFCLWQCGGHGFESRMLHLKKSVNTRLSGFRQYDGIPSFLPFDYPLTTGISKYCPGSDWDEDTWATLVNHHLFVHPPHKLPLFSPLACLGSAPNQLISLY